MPRSPISRRGLCLVIAGPSGVGKSAIAAALLAAEPATTLSVSVTTRTRRSAEREAKHYYFRDHAAFDALIAAGALLEWAEVFGNRYGTLRAPVEAALGAGRDVVFVIDWQGHQRLREVLPGDVVGVCILPPERAALAERLRSRGDDETAVARRMATASGEIAHWHEFRHVVVNVDLAQAVTQVRTILNAARLETARQSGLARFVAGLCEANAP